LTTKGNGKSDDFVKHGTLSTPWSGVRSPIDLELTGAFESFDKSFYFNQCGWCDNINPALRNKDMERDGVISHAE